MRNFPFEMRPTLILFVLLNSLSFAQIAPTIGAEANGLGCTSLSSKDVFSVYNNPGALGQIENTGVGFTYDNRFLLKELSTQSLAAAYKMEKNGAIGLHLQHYGFGLYREMFTGVSYGISLAPNFSLGTSVNFHRIQLGDNYGSTNALSLGLGMFYSVNEELSFGMRVANLTRTRLAEFEDERLPTTFGLGLQYIFSEKVFWNLEAEKNFAHPINIKTGLGFQPHELIALRMGVNSYPFQSTFGLGVTMPKFRFDISAGWHAQLGISPSVGLVFSF